MHRMKYWGKIYFMYFNMPTAIVLCVCRILSFSTFWRNVSYKILKKYIYSKYRDKIDNDLLSFRVEAETELKGDNIWVFWWQGYDELPEVVSVCVNSIKEHCGNCNVILLDKNNVSDYVKLSDKILELQKEGKILLSALSDVIRCYLLSAYGGLWLDATIFVTKDIDYKLFDTEFWSIKNLPDSFWISKAKWTTFCWGSRPGSILFNYLYNFLCVYYEEHDYCIDYMVVDILLMVGYEHISRIKNYVDNVEYSNPDVLALMKRINVPFSEDEWKAMIDNNQFSKLSYKKKTYKYDGDNVMTFFGYISSLYE